MPGLRYRFMRIVLFFDLPTITPLDRKVYRKFRKFLINDGFIMIQESVYVKITTNYNSCNSEIERIKKNKPDNGLVQCLVITEKQYSGIINITGELNHQQIDSMDRLLVL